MTDSTERLLTDERLAEIRQYRNHFPNDYIGTYLRELLDEVDRLRTALRREITSARVELLSAEGNELTAWASDAETDEERLSMIDRGFALIGFANALKRLLPPAPD